MISPGMGYEKTKCHNLGSCKYKEHTQMTTHKTQQKEKKKSIPQPSDQTNPLASDFPFSLSSKQSPKLLPPIQAQMRQHQPQMIKAPKRLFFSSGIGSHEPRQPERAFLERQLCVFAQVLFGGCLSALLLLSAITLKGHETRRDIEGWTEGGKGGGGYLFNNALCDILS